MAKLKVTQFALSTASAGNTQTVDISGFGTPTAAIMFHCEADTNGASATSSRLSIGFTDGTRQNCCSFYANDALATSQVSRHISDAAVIVTPDGTGTVFSQFSFNSWSANGIVLDIDVASAEGELVTLILIQADDEYSGLINLGTGTSAIDITSPGFEPDIVFFSSAGKGGTVPGGDEFFQPAFGIWVNDGSDTQRAFMAYQADGSALTVVRSGVYDTFAIGQMASGGTTTYQVTVGSADASGFSVTPSASTSSDYCAYLALKLTGLNVSLFNLSIPTSGDYAETTPGFTPNFGLIASLVGPTSRNTGNAANTTIAITAFDGSSIFTTSISSEHNNTTSNENSYADNSLSFQKGDSSGLAVDSSGYAFDADGWDFTLTTNPAAAVLGWGLAIGAAATAALGIRNPLFGPVTLRNPLGRFN